MRYLVVVTLACLMASFVIEEALGVGVRNNFAGGAHGGRRYNDIFGGGGSRGFNSGSGGGRFDEGRRRDSFTSFTNSEHDSGHLSSGSGARGINTGGGGRFGSAHRGGSGFGNGLYSGRRIGHGFGIGK